MIAYHFPPIHESSGLQRTLKFATHLRSHGWQPIILTICPRAYPSTSTQLMNEIPDDIPIYRAFGLDTARHLSITGRYPRFLAIPDRHASWFFDGVWSGMRIINKYKPAAIWSTYPIATAHRIGCWLQRFSGLPWIADFRDPMAQDDYPTDPAIHAAYVKIERETIRRCSKAVFATPGARNLYAERYQSESDDKFSVILNGYDEATFQHINPSNNNTGNAQLRLVHSGILYPSERDPTQFFRAIARLKNEGTINQNNINILLRATGHDDVFQPELDALNISDIVTLAPRIAYREALAEMMDADGLLLFQAANCNQQIPAKAYEYLRTQRPILALTDPDGDTASTLRQAGSGMICRLDDADDIYNSLSTFITKIRDHTVAIADLATVEAYERSTGAAELANLLDEVTRS